MVGLPGREGGREVGKEGADEKLGKGKEQEGKTQKPTLHVGACPSLYGCHRNQQHTYEYSSGYKPHPTGYIPCNNVNPLLWQVLHIRTCTYWCGWCTGMDIHVHIALSPGFHWNKTSTDIHVPVLP